MKPVNVYGIPNCDVTKKAINWLKKQDIVFEFHNFKTEGISKDKLIAWNEKEGWQTFFNKKSTTWKLVAANYKNEVNSLQDAIKIIQEHNSIIKRPVIETGNSIIVGYDEKKLSSLINNH